MTTAEPLSLPQPNIPLLRKAVEWAEAEAAKTDGTGLWDQGAYAVPMDCGTSYCVAGWAVVTADPTVVVNQWGDFLRGGAILDPRKEGERVLGITASEGLELFLSSNSITDVRCAAESIAARAGERL